MPDQCGTVCTVSNNTFPNQTVPNFGVHFFYTGRLFESARKHYYLFIFLAKKKILEGFYFSVILWILRNQTCHLHEYD